MHIVRTSVELQSCTIKVSAITYHRTYNVRDGGILHPTGRCYPHRRPGTQRLLYLTDIPCPKVRIPGPEFVASQRDNHIVGLRPTKEALQGVQIGCPTRSRGPIPAYRIQGMAVLPGIVGEAHGQSLHHGIAKEQNPLATSIGSMGHHGHRIGRNGNPGDTGCLHRLILPCLHAIRWHTHAQLLCPIRKGLLPQTCLAHRVSIEIQQTPTNGICRHQQKRYQKNKYQSCVFLHVAFIK